MPLSPGTRLGPYEISSAIGAGGMGEVYRARDMRLNRDVAVKVLPESFATDPDRRARFEREAQAIAALSHPNILAIHDTGSHAPSSASTGSGQAASGQAVLYVVTELLNGETLRAPLETGALPIRKAIDIALQIARGLAAAHEKGIVHRDLKPENVFLLHDGQVKILDFGLARHASPASGATETAAPLTDPGAVMGTVGYMAPEQVRGLSTDARTDLFALGAVLYEMLSGQRAFTGDTAADTLFAIVKKDPPELTRTRADLSHALVRIVRHCLEKNPAERFQTARDVAFALEGVSGSSSGMTIAASATTASSRSFRRPLLAGAGSLALAIAALAGAAVMRWTQTRPASQDAVEPARHVSIALRTDAPLVFIGEATAGIGQTALALSADGQHLVYVGRADKTTRLYIRDMTDPIVRPITGTEGAYAPFFSPDGQWIAFFVGQRLMRVRADGTQVSALAETDWPYGGSWSDDGRIAVVTNDATKLILVTSAGATPTVVARRDPTFGIMTPSWLPGGDWVLLGCGIPQHVCAMSTRTGDNRHLVIDGPAVQNVEGAKLLVGSNPRYLAPGILVYSAASTNTVMGVRFDPVGLTVIGDPAELLRGVRRENAGSLQLSIAANGDAVFASGANAVVGRLVWADRSGTVTTLPFGPRSYGPFFLSSDARRIVAKVYPEVGPAELWFLEIATGKEHRWVDEGLAGDRELWPGPWLPGTTQSIVHAWGKSNVTFIVDSARASGGKLLRSGPEQIWVEAISKDRRLILDVVTPGRPVYESSITLEEFQRLGNDAGQTWRPIIASTGAMVLCDVSPDMKWLTYTSDESGPYEVWATRLPPHGPPIRVSNGGGETPRWSPRGDGFYYRSGQRWYWVALRSSDTEPFAPPEFVLEGDYLNVAGPEFQVSPDGTRLLLLQGSSDRTQSTLDVITNWRAELERKLPRRAQ